MKKKNQKHVEEQSARKARRLFQTLFFLCLQASVLASQHFTFTENCIAAQHACLELRLGDAQRLIEQIKESDPENLAPHLIEHQRAMLIAFVQEDEQSFEELKDLHDEVYKKIASSHSGLKHRKFALAEIDFQLALLKAKHNEFYSAGRLISSAHKLLVNNQKSHPDLVINTKTLGLIQAFLSTVPKNYEWAVKLLGFKGDLDKGLKQLKEVSMLEENQVNGAYNLEAAYLYAFTQGRIANDHQKAWEAIEPISRNYSTSSLSAYFRASLAGKVQRNEEVIHVLSARPKSGAYHPFPFMDYMLGTAQLNNLSEEAIHSFQRFLSNTKGEHFKKSCLQLMAWYYYLFDKPTQYENCRQRIANEGVDLYEEDKLAMRFIEKPHPNEELLKARLLFDGGYYQRALDIIGPLKAKDFATSDEKAEYSYRKGRIYQKLNRNDVASLFFIASSKFGVQSTEYYAAYSCLHLGDYYLSIGQNDKALSYYKKVKSYKKNEEYKDSIEQQAMNGIRKCSS